MMKTLTLAGFLDKELNVSAFEDSSHNGLQVEFVDMGIEV